MDDKIRFALENTEIIKQPKKFLATYESTTVHYYILAVPFYLEFEGKSLESETIIREGRITWQKPKLITPSYILRMEGFSDEAKKAFEILASGNYDIAFMLYRLKFVKDYDHMEIVSNSLQSVAKKIGEEIEKRQDPFCAIIKGVDEFWDVSLSRFIYELALNSAYFSQAPDLSENNMIGINPEGIPVISKDKYGIPVAARVEIENLFKLYEKGEIEASKLKEEIDNWGLFNLYQDRFFSMFKKHK
ncbi:MAG: hypothetical protein M1326_07590 [Cyanobacteria bacterium]|nr:hypothetical protein [Cyanobacteriota bacterium]